MRWQLLILLALCGASGLFCAGPGSPTGEVRMSASTNKLAGPQDLGGFVVWESNRSGRWRLWRRGLAGGTPRQLTPEEGERQHCCPHIAPDGRSIAYLSLDAGKQRYPERGGVGELRVIAADGTPVASLGRARTYFENRAAVWQSPSRLIYIDEGAATRLYDVASSEDRQLLAPSAAGGKLLNGPLTFATGGRPEFAAYDRHTGRLGERRVFDGCQPYFSADGRSAYWVAGAGGPLRRLRFEDGAVETFLRRNDERLAPGWGYLYFPMLSHDATLLAYAASQGGHDHYRSDYEIFVVEVDPQTLEPLETPLRLTDDPRTDRFPAVWRPALELGRVAGEAPYRAAWEVDGESVVEWSFGDGGSAFGSAAAHVYETPGRYLVMARREDSDLRGLVVVTAPAAPRLLEARVRPGGEEIELRLNEPVDVRTAALRLASGRSIEQVTTADDDRTLVLRLDGRLERPDELVIDGLADRAATALRLTTKTPLEPPIWPAFQDALVLMWPGGPDRGAFELSGAVRAERAGLSLEGGVVLLEADRSAAVGGRVKNNNELTLEVEIVPRQGRLPRPAPVVSLASSARRRNFALLQDGRHLVLRLRTGRENPERESQILLTRIEPGRPVHLVASYSPGELFVFVNGEEIVVPVREGDFFHWRPGRLVIGGEWGSEVTWRGEVHALAIYDRALSARQAQWHYRQRAL